MLKQIHKGQAHRGCRDLGSGNPKPKTPVCGRNRGRSREGVPPPPARCAACPASPQSCAHVCMAHGSSPPSDCSSDEESEWFEISDFSTVTAWERLVAAMEQTLRGWAGAGPGTVPCAPGVLAAEVGCWGQQYTLHYHDTAHMPDPDPALLSGLGPTQDLRNSNHDPNSPVTPQAHATSNPDPGAPSACARSTTPPPSPGPSPALNPDSASDPDTAANAQPTGPVEPSPAVAARIGLELTPEGGALDYTTAMLETAGDFCPRAHVLRQWFGITRFLVLTPNRGCIDPPQAPMLLSALICACVAVRVQVPCFVSEVCRAVPGWGHVGGWGRCWKGGVGVPSLRD